MWTVMYLCQMILFQHFGSLVKLLQATAHKPAAGIKPQFAFSTTESHLGNVQL